MGFEATMAIIPYFQLDAVLIVNDQSNYSTVFLCKQPQKLICMHSVTDCFHSNHPSLRILSTRRNLSAATKHGDLTDKTPSACKSNILSLSPSPSHPKHLSFTLERGDRIGKGSPDP
ncbi:hypothetical protein AVEN_42053-1 [Araneus ventricosus]|uniref:Uncharacterized protein n=1 Tax=Araneus ventricosus TaxID=182803 RepID=A0A4Y2UJW2_ARAVE|nr:hypothetical protein AVEN_28191-1 [Araneus ventricosus]GBO11965.1 hypothetical protein AVEN_42053-1 [Araneus ventricosus]